MKLLMNIDLRMFMVLRILLRSNSGASGKRLIRTPYIFVEITLNGSVKEKYPAITCIEGIGSR